MSEMSEMSEMTKGPSEPEEEAQMEGAEEMPVGMMDAGEQEVIESGRIAEVHGDLVLEEMPGSEM